MHWRKLRAVVGAGPDPHVLIFDAVAHIKSMRVETRINNR
jgi:hypothetical protein